MTELFVILSLCLTAFVFDGLVAINNRLRRIESRGWTVH